MAYSVVALTVLTMAGQKVERSAASRADLSVGKMAGVSVDNLGVSLDSKSVGLSAELLVEKKVGY